MRLAIMSATMTAATITANARTAFTGLHLLERYSAQWAR